MCETGVWWLLHVFIWRLKRLFPCHPTTSFGLVQTFATIVDMHYYIFSISLNFLFLSVRLSSNLFQVQGFQFNGNSLKRFRIYTRIKVICHRCFKWKQNAITLSLCNIRPARPQPCSCRLQDVYLIQDFHAIRFPQSFGKLQLQVGNQTIVWSDISVTGLWFPPANQIPVSGLHT